jgi:ribosome-binding protein aMBF1 (putative translation factor)
MTAQIIKTEGGEEIVILSRREYDALLARLGNEAAEDRMTERMAREARARLDAGAEIALPAWLGEAVARGDTAVKAARKRAGKTQAALAEEVGIVQSYLSDIERGDKRGTPEVLQRIAKALGADPRWLAD